MELEIDENTFDIDSDGLVRYKPSRAIGHARIWASRPKDYQRKVERFCWLMSQAAYPLHAGTDYRYGSIWCTWSRQGPHPETLATEVAGVTSIILDVFRDEVRGVEFSASEIGVPAHDVATWMKSRGLRFKGKAPTQDPSHAPH